MIIKQNGNSGLLLQILKVSKNGQNRGLDAERSRLREIEREREHFSLKMRAIRPSAVFGPRRKDVLRGAGYMWTPVL